MLLVIILAVSVVATVSLRLWFWYQQAKLSTLLHRGEAYRSPIECDLSIVIPAFDERARLPHTLNDLFKIIKLTKSLKSCEIIVVDDGSRDNTSALARHVFSKLRKKFGLCSDFLRCVVIDLGLNFGKDMAVTQVRVSNFFT